MSVEEKRHMYPDADGHGRWCGVCNTSHGIMYRCPYYDPIVNVILEIHHKQWQLKLCDPGWIRAYRERERARGLPEHTIEIALAIQRAFAGVAHDAPPVH